MLLTHISLKEGQAICCNFLASSKQHRINEKYVVHRAIMTKQLKVHTEQRGEC